MPRTHRAEEPGVDDARPREALEEHLDAEDEHDGVCRDGGSESGAGIDEESRELFEARRERGGGRGASRRHRPGAAPEGTWTRPVRESAQSDACALRLVTHRAESRRPRARTAHPCRRGGDACRRYAVRLHRRRHRAVLPRARGWSLGANAVPHTAVPRCGDLQVRWDINSSFPAPIPVGPATRFEPFPSIFQES